MIPQKAITILLSLVLFSFSGNMEKETLRKGKDYAVFFAVEQYENWKILRNPISDATSIANELKNNYGFETEVVKNPSRIEILDKIEEYRKKQYTSDAQLLIFFSGHGDFIKSKKEGFFIPADGKLADKYQDSYISHTRLGRSINTLPCNHVLLAIDACFSGTFDKAIALNRGDERPGAQENKRQGFINRSLKYKSRLYLTSGGKVRTPDESQFVKQFLSALRNFGGSDGIVSFNELEGSLETARPQPKSGQFGDHEPGGKFLMILDDNNNTSKSSVTTSTPKGNSNTLKNNTTTTSNIDPRLADLNGWKAAEKTKSLEGYQKYIREFTNGAFIGQAKQKEKSLLEETEWEIVNMLGTKEAYQKYIREFPNGANIDKAKQKEKSLSEETEWEIANMLDTKEAYQKYIDDYPNGMHHKEAISQRQKFLKKIGDLYQGGYVFQIDDRGDHGLVCSEVDLGQGMWQYAVSKCESYSEGGYTDWYLPSKEELKMMYTELYKNALGGFASGVYWSSTEVDGSRAWELYFGSGGQGATNKVAGRRVRAVRAF